jgi:hypothetical protein
MKTAPTSQRFGQDPFMSRALPATETKQVRMVLNPAMAKLEGSITKLLTTEISGAPFSASAALIR